MELSHEHKNTFQDFVDFHSRHRSVFVLYLLYRKRNPMPAIWARPAAKGLWMCNLFKQIYAIHQKAGALLKTGQQYRLSNCTVLTEVVILDHIGYAIFSDATLRAFDLDSGQELGYWQPDDDILAQWPANCITEPEFHDCTAGPLAPVGLTVAEDTLVVSFGGNKLYALGTP